MNRFRKSPIAKFLTIAVGIGFLLVPMNTVATEPRHLLSTNATTELTGNLLDHSQITHPNGIVHPNDIQAFMAEHGMDYAVWMGDLAVVKKTFHVMGFPTSLLIDREGLIHKRYFGPHTEEVFKQDVEPLLE